MIQDEKDEHSIKALQSSDIAYGTDPVVSGNSSADFIVIDSEVELNQRFTVRLFEVSRGFSYGCTNKGFIFVLLTLNKVFADEIVYLS